MRDPHARWLPSPNFAPGRPEPVRFVVLHGTFSETEARSLDYLLRSQAPHRVSSHYLITYDGEILQLVDEGDVAWHAGRSAWGDGDRALNASSVGIEISNRGAVEPYAEVQLVALEGLLRRTCARWSIPPARVLGHSDIAPDRKVDPGPHFPWPRLERAGLAAPWVPACADASPQEALHTWGWRGAPDAVVRAFQLRYLPDHLSETLDPWTIAAIRGEVTGA